MADPADSNSASAGNVRFKMIRFAKIILSAKLNGLAPGLLTMSAPAAQPAAGSAHRPFFFEANQGQAVNPAQFFRLYKF